MAIKHEEFAADVIALRAMVHALVKSHPDPAKLLEAFRAERELFNAMSLGSKASDGQLNLLDRKLAAFELTLQTVVMEQQRKR